ncbi:MAG: DNA starvation/stationary phase protection protein Dps [Alphaproteobacteria bacterium]|nr:DNA starvation/stationary phase protection protein Dps [Alphaproteobacteria bacterium]
MSLHRTRIDLPSQIRDAAVRVLNARLADTIVLASHAKQAHWNVKGPNFIALHELFDQLHTDLLPFVDDIAERITALGGTAVGTAGAAARASELPDYPLDIADGAAHVEALATAYAAFAERVRKAIEETGEIGDADTADLFTGLSRLADKNLWLLEAHLQARS